jgi:hypothetical protein
MNPPVSAEPMESVLPPGPGTAAREEGISAIASGYQGVPAKQMQAASALAPEEFSRPDVYSGNRFVSGAGAENEEDYNKRWQMASALESAGKPYWEVARTKEGAYSKKPVFQPEKVLQGALDAYGGGLEAGVQKDIATAKELMARGDYYGAESALKKVEAKYKPQEVESKSALEKAQAGEAGAHGAYWGAKGEEAKTTNKSNKEMNSALNKLDIEEQKEKAAFSARYGIPSGQSGLLIKTDTITQKAFDDIEAGFAQKRQSVLQRYSVGAGVAPSAPLDTATEALKQRAKAGDVKAQQYLTTKGVSWQ